MHGDFLVGVRTHCRQEQRHTTATVRCLAQGAIDLARGNNGLVIRRPHPVYGCVDIVIGDVLAMTDDHNDKTFLGLLENGLWIIEAV